jgi:hypothetical protein
MVGSGAWRLNLFYVQDKTYYGGCVFVSPRDLSICRRFGFPLAVVLFVLFTSAVEAQLKKVRFSVSAAAIAEVPFRIAHLKGFYRDEGIGVESIFIRGQVGLQALLGGSVDYSSASGSTIAAAVRGIPVKLVFIASAADLAAGGFQPPRLFRRLHAQLSERRHWRHR